MKNVKPSYQAPVEVFHNLFVGPMETRLLDAYTLYACKTGHERVVGKHDPGDDRYLTHFGEVCASLNLIDVPDTSYFEPIGVSGINAAMDWIDMQTWTEGWVQIVCDQGRTRSAGIAALYLATRGMICDVSTIPTSATVEAEFRNIYPSWEPHAFWDWIVSHWDHFNWLQ